ESALEALNVGDNMGLFVGIEAEGRHGQMLLAHEGFKPRVILAGILSDFHEAGSGAAAGAERLHLMARGAPALGDLQAAIGIDRDLNTGEGPRLKVSGRSGSFLIGAGGQEEEQRDGGERNPVHFFSLCRFLGSWARGLTPLR